MTITSTVFIILLPRTSEDKYHNSGKKTFLRILFHRGNNKYPIENEIRQEVRDDESWSSKHWVTLGKYRMQCGPHFGLLFYKLEIIFDSNN